MDASWPWSDRRCFFLEQTPEEGEPRLAPEDALHLARVLRARVGEPLLGLDGRGSAWPLQVAALEGRGVRVEVSGAAFREAPPGAAEARLRRVEVAVAWPRPQAGEELVDGLTQLGCAKVTALVSGRSQEWARDWSPARRARLERVGREACKQARRLWQIELDGPLDLEAWLASVADAPGATVLLEPRAETSLPEWLAVARRRDAQRPVRLLIGPEGGWSDHEREACRERGLGEARIASYVLRTELAAQAAVSIALQ